MKLKNSRIIFFKERRPEYLQGIHASPRFERLEAEREAGKAVLVSSHVMSFVERVSDRIGVMRAGLLVAQGTPNELRTQTGLLEEDFIDVFFQLAE